MCVTRPIHVSAGITRNSWYGLMKPVEHHHNKSSANDSGIDSAIEVSPSVCESCLSMYCSSLACYNYAINCVPIVPNKIFCHPTH